MRYAPRMLPPDFVLPHPDEYERVCLVASWTDEQLQTYADELQSRHEVLAAEAQVTGEARYRRMITINAEVASPVHQELERRQAARVG
jgi:hypothetical protein